ncbi:MAG: septal ring lytic transglycosylase RlpA family protein [Bacteroidota bacterium]
MRHYTIAFVLLILCSVPGISQEEFGEASYYSDSFHGLKTASGELYDKNKLTAAHKKLPYGTFLKVTRLDNKKSVTVRVIDRGPYIQGRVVDLSRKAAERLDLITAGRADVKIEVVRGPSTSEATVAAAPPPPAPEPAKESKPKVNKSPKPTAYNTKEKDAPRLNTRAASEKKTAPKPKAQIAPTVAAAGPAKSKTIDGAKNTELVTAKNYKPYGLYKIELSKPKSYGFGVQVAVVSQHERMMQQVAEYQGKWFKNVLVNIDKGANGQAVYKIILGSFPDRASANNYKDQLKKKKKIDGFVVDLSDLNKDG